MKIFKEDGHLSQNGEDTFKQHLDKEIHMLLATAKTDTEIQIIGSLIQKRVADIVSNQLHLVKNKRMSVDKLTSVHFTIVHFTIQPDCTGHFWRDEFGSEFFTHDEYIFCPVCDVK